MADKEEVISICKSKFVEKDRSESEIIRFENILKVYMLGGLEKEYPVHDNKINELFRNATFMTLGTYS